MARRHISIGQGQLVPYPEPTSSAATKVGKGNRRTGTRPEQMLRAELHRRGRRFRKDLLIRAADVRTHADVVFTRRRLAVFVDGCFWHGCPRHGTSPKSNTDYWGPKLRANVERDRRVDCALRREGWTVLRIWEHETVDAAADLVESALDDIGA